MIYCFLIRLLNDVVIFHCCYRTRCGVTHPQVTLPEVEIAEYDVQSLSDGSSNGSQVGQQIQDAAELILQQVLPQMQHEFRLQLSATNANYRSILRQTAEKNKAVITIQRMVRSASFNGKIKEVQKESNDKLKSLENRYQQLEKEQVNNQQTIRRLGAQLKSQQQQLTGHQTKEIEWRIKMLEAYVFRYWNKEGCWFSAEEISTIQGLADDLRKECAHDPNLVAQLKKLTFDIRLSLRPVLGAHARDFATDFQKAQALYPSTELRWYNMFWKDFYAVPFDKEKTDMTREQARTEYEHIKTGLDPHGDNLLQSLLKTSSMFSFVKNSAMQNIERHQILLRVLEPTKYRCEWPVH